MRKADFVLVGGGRLARAIEKHFGSRCAAVVRLSSALFSSANVPKPFPSLPVGLRPIVYCFGPAGDAAVRADAAGAALAHVVLPAMLRERNPGAPFVYVSSLLAGAPTWYGTLKAMGEDAVYTDGRGLHLMRLGSVLDPEYRRGVASRFFWQARQRKFPLRVPRRERTVAVVTVPLVLRALETLLAQRPGDWPLYSDVGYAIALRDLARSIASRTTRGLVRVAADAALADEPDFLPVRKPLFPLPPIETALTGWVRGGMRRPSKEGKHHDH